MLGRGSRTEGFWKMAHEAYTDCAILLGSISLLLLGAGAWSVDAKARP
jgi:uncharacterized membrane protein YphA (DoxX/SURF4 family)